MKSLYRVLLLLVLLACAASGQVSPRQHIALQNAGTPVGDVFGKATFNFTGCATSLSSGTFGIDCTQLAGPITVGGSDSHLELAANPTHVAGAGHLWNYGSGVFKLGATGATVCTSAGCVITGPLDLTGSTVSVTTGTAGTSDATPASTQFVQQNIPINYQMSNSSTIQTVKATQYYAWKGALMTASTTVGLPEYAKASCTVTAVEYWFNISNTLDTGNSGDTIQFKLFKDCGMGTTTCTELTTLTPSAITFYDVWGNHVWVSGGTDTLTSNESFICGAIMSSLGTISTNANAALGCRVICR